MLFSNQAVLVVCHSRSNGSLYRSNTFTSFSCTVLCVLLDGFIDKRCRVVWHCISSAGISTQFGRFKFTDNFKASLNIQQHEPTANGGTFTHNFEADCEKSNDSVLFPPSTIHTTYVMRRALKFCPCAPSPRGIGECVWVHVRLNFSMETHG